MKPTTAYDAATADLLVIALHLLGMACVVVATIAWLHYREAQRMKRKAIAQSDYLTAADMVVSDKGDLIEVNQTEA